MTLDQFRQLAETWGGNIDRWPSSTRDAALALAAGDEGKRILADQVQLDRLLAIAPDVSDERVGRAGFAVLHKVAHSNLQVPRLRWSLRRLLPAASLACSALVGLWLAGALSYRQNDEALSVVSMVFDSTAMTLWRVQ
jgi:hypothetical protein